MTTVSPTANKVPAAIGRIFPESRLPSLAFSRTDRATRYAGRGTEKARENENRFLGTTQMTALVNGARGKRVILAITFFLLIIFFLFLRRWRVTSPLVSARQASISTYTTAPPAMAKVRRDTATFKARR